MNVDPPAARAGVAPAGAALLDGLPDAAWLVDLATQAVVAANAAAAALFGRPGASLVGEPAAVLADSPEDRAYWAAAAAGDRGPLQSDTVVVGVDGGTRHVSRSIRPIAVAGDADGTAPTHALVVLSDRSAERRAEDEREMLLGELQSTLEATADGILVTDGEGRVRAFNRRLAEIWSMPDALLDERDDAGLQAWMQRGVVDGRAWERRLQALSEARSPRPSSASNCTAAGCWTA